MSKVPVIDVHTHSVSDAYIEAIKKYAGPEYTIKEVIGGQQAVHRNGAPFMTLTPPMFDWDLRIKDMDKVGIDISIVSLTCPNVFWGGEEVSASIARMINKEFAAAQTQYPDRIRWYATLPWQYPNAAIAELKTAVSEGAVGVVVLGNIAGKSLTDPQFAPVWEEIDKLGLPVQIHPTAPQGMDEMDLLNYNLIASLGFMYDSSLALARMIFDGFFDRYRNLKIISLHGGAGLPFFIGRLDYCYEKMPACRVKISEKPSTYFLSDQIFIDAVVNFPETMDFIVKVKGADNVLYGTDYPHNISDPEGILERVNGLRNPVTKKKILGLNAQRIFKL